MDNRRSVYISIQIFKKNLLYQYVYQKQARGVRYMREDESVKNELFLTIDLHYLEKFYIHRLEFSFL